MERADKGCDGCGTLRATLQMHFVVPLEDGGALIDSNVVLLCMRCLLRGSDRRGSRQGELAFVTFWVSQRLSQRVLRLVEKHRVASINSLINARIRHHMEDPSSLEPELQDVGTDTKLLARVDNEVYSGFKRDIESRGLTVTDAIKALLLKLIREVEDE